MSLEERIEKLENEVKFLKETAKIFSQFDRELIKMMTEFTKNKKADDQMFKHFQVNVGELQS